MLLKSDTIEDNMARQEKKKDIPKRTVSLPEKYRTNTPVIRSLSTYEYAMERSGLSD